MMTEDQLADLTPREAAVMRALIAEREAYIAAGDAAAAAVVWKAIEKAWQILGHPEPPRFRKHDSRVVQARAIDKLSDPHRQAMRLKLLEDKTVDYIAAEMGMSVSDAQQLLSEAGAKMRTILATVVERRGLRSDLI
jgi:DNA-directed RNA polymerase specialized sigma24 family protein